MPTPIKVPCMECGMIKQVADPGDAPEDQWIRRYRCYACCREMARDNLERIAFGKEEN